MLKKFIHTLESISQEYKLNKILFTLNFPAFSIFKA